MQLPKLKLTEKEVEQLADVLSDIATITAAATIIPSLLSKFNSIHLAIGVLISTILWIASIKILKLWIK